METKHTKGEWYAHIDRDKFYEATEIKVFSNINGRTMICNLTDAAKNLNINNEFEANAKLIAAAPDLLQALIEINKMCADAGNVENGKLNVGKIAKITINAINKATK